jgi:DNA phosphorothioation-dependent restriction protein DptH
MNRLVDVIADTIRHSVQESIRASGGAEFRRLFHGPPQEVLVRVLEALSFQGGIEALRPSGESVVVLVVRQVGTHALGVTNPSLDKSGDCDSFHLMNLRNSNPPIERWIALLSPGSHVDLSIASAVSEFGVGSAANSGTATIQDWISDSYISGLITTATERVANSPESRQLARQLIEAALRSADERDQYSVQRSGAWAVLARVFDIPEGSAHSSQLLSLACGVPPHEDGTLLSVSQRVVLDQLANKFEEEGFRRAISVMAEDTSDADQLALAEFLADISCRCAVPTAFSRAALSVYGPAQGWTLDSPPNWWNHLTVERWTELLDEDSDDVERAVLSFSCTNSLIAHALGVSAVVSDEVHLDVSVHQSNGDTAQVNICRKSNSIANRRDWSVDAARGGRIIDAGFTMQSRVLSYSAELDSNKRELKVISLACYAPGIFVAARTASKVTPPKAVSSKAGGGFETSITLEGSGRHYLDVFASSWAQISAEAPCYDSNDQPIAGRTASLERVKDHHYALEVEVNEDCTYVIVVGLSSGESHKVRVNISLEEITGKCCSSEFERLIKLNLLKSANVTVGVHVPRTGRAADLQAWALEPASIHLSFYPVVVASDLDQHWLRTDWSTTGRTVFSGGRYLADPRPTREEMQAPDAFITARRTIAEFVRGKDGYGLVESSLLGELAAKPKFSDAVQDYLQAYSQWLRDEPDVAPWADVIAVSAADKEGVTLALEPVAIMLSPLHPIRLGWHVAAQRTLWQAYSNQSRCPAASILDPRCVPDVLSLPLRTASGSISRRAYLAVDSSSDYWSVLWNCDRLDAIPEWAGVAPFNQEFGVTVGGISSGFSTAQVGNALDDVFEMFAAKPTLNVLVSSAAGQTNACNEGILDWCRERLSTDHHGDETFRHQARVGPRRIQILDERPIAGRPDDAELANLAEDTGNAVLWFDASKATGISPDLGIIAQLDAANGSGTTMSVRSPLSAGALIRHRVRQQLTAANGAFLCESRTGGLYPSSGDALLDHLAAAVACLENLTDSRVGYSFAPSITAVHKVLARATFAAVSSSAVDPACFLGGWMGDSFLWEYDLPSYSQRAGDSNGYYLLSQTSKHVIETLGAAISKLPGCVTLGADELGSILREVASRGIPTVGGLSSGDHKASGDLGLFIASRLLQDDFRGSTESGILRVAEETNGRKYVNLILPVDPFRGYLEDLGRSLKLDRNRPDLLVASFDVTDARVTCKLTPIEVKYRGTAVMTVSDRLAALDQARSLTRLLNSVRNRAASSGALLWSLAFQHLLLTMVNFGLRVYSQKRLGGDSGREWAGLHEKIIGAILTSEIDIEIDDRGRLIVIDSATTSASSDDDQDGFHETLVMSLQDAAGLVLEGDDSFQRSVRRKLGSWGLLAARPDAGTPLDTRESRDSGNSTVSDELPPTMGRSDTSAPEPVVVEEAMHPVESASLSEDSVDVDAARNDDPQRDDGSPPGGDFTPGDSPGVRVHVGYTSGSFKAEPRILRLSETELNHLNIGVVGDLGTGKTQFLKSLILQAASAASENRGIRPRFLIFDYKNDYASADFVKAVGAKVVRPRNIPLNIFDVGDNPDPGAWLQRFNFFFDTLSKVFAGIGPVQRQKLKVAVKIAYEQAGALGKQPTLRDVHREYAANMGNNADAPFGIIDDLIDMEVFAENPPSDATFGSFFDGVVVLSLSDLGQDDRNKNLLVALFLNMFYEYMLTIPKRPYEGQPQKRALDSFLLVDEADNIMKYEFDVLRKLLLQGREFGVGIVLASQYLKHFKVNATDYREPLLSWFVHKVPNVTAQEISALGLTDDLSELAVKVKQLANHHCLFKTVGVAGEIVKVTPFHELVKGI